MIKNLFNKLLKRNVTKRKKTFTIINENRETKVRYSYCAKNKNERQDSCLSKYFENIKGLNQIERNIYSKTF